MPGSGGADARPGVTSQIGILGTERESTFAEEEIISIGVRGECALRILHGHGQCDLIAKGLGQADSILAGENEADVIMLYS